jgi:thymidylate kinase
MDITQLLELTNILAKYPFAEKIVLLVITLLFARREIKKRFKDLTEGMGKLADAFDKHLEVYEKRHEDHEKRFMTIESHIGLSKAKTINIPQEE